MANTTLNDKLSLVYYLLASRYANSNIASSDEERFKWNLFSTMFQYGPTWVKKLELQKNIRNTDIAEFQKGTRTIVNQAANPATAPSTRDTEELSYVNKQNVNKTTRSIADAYALVLSLLEEDVTEEFIGRFKKLFLTIVAPERPLWYVTYADGEVEDDLNSPNGATLTANFRTRYFAQIFPTVDDFIEEWNSLPFSQEV